MNMEKWGEDKWVFDILTLKVTWTGESDVDSDITIVHEWIFRAISSMKAENKCES